MSFKSFNIELKDFLRGLSREKQCCKRAYLAGLEAKELTPACAADAPCFIQGIFIRCGFISSPGASPYLSMYFGAGQSDFAFYTNAVLSAVGAEGNLEAKVSRRKSGLVLYYRETEKIEDFLAFCGASKYALAYMEQKIINELRSEANRLRNAETANINRAVKAAFTQCAKINALKKTKQYAALPQKLKECAELRTENPDKSLEELRMLFETPITKSGLNHRLSRLMKLADELDL